MNKAMTALTLCACGAIAAAHEGHGLPGTSHWHASDVLLALGVGAVVAALAWFGRRK